MITKTIEFGTAHPEVVIIIAAVIFTLLKMSSIGQRHKNVLNEVVKIILSSSDKDILSKVRDESSLKPVEKDKLAEVVAKHDPELPTPTVSAIVAKETVRTLTFNERLAREVGRHMAYRVKPESKQERSDDDLV